MLLTMIYNRNNMRLLILSISFIFCSCSAFRHADKTVTKKDSVSVQKVDNINAVAQDSCESKGSSDTYQRVTENGYAVITVPDGYDIDTSGFMSANDYADNTVSEKPKALIIDKNHNVK